MCSHFCRCVLRTVGRLYDINFVVGFSKTKTGTVLHYTCLSSKFVLPLLWLFLQGKIVAQGRLLLQDTFMVSDQDGGLLSRMKERRVFLFEQIVIFSEPLDKKKGFSTPGYLFKNSIKVSAAQ